MNNCECRQYINSEWHLATYNNAAGLVNVKCDARPDTIGKSKGKTYEGQFDMRPESHMTKHDGSFE